MSKIRPIENLHQNVPKFYSYNLNETHSKYGNLVTKLGLQRYKCGIRSSTSPGNQFTRTINLSSLLHNFVI